MADPDNALLCVFSHDKYVVIDDYNQKIVDQPRLIRSTWPQLSQFGMDADLDAVCFDKPSNTFFFFKGANCAIYNHDANTWEHGAITDYFNLPAPNAAVDFTTTIDGAVVADSSEPGVAGQFFMNKGEFYVQGTSGSPTRTAKLTLGGPVPLSASLWSVPAGKKVVAAESIYPAGSAAAGAGARRVSTLVLADAQQGQASNNYGCLFYGTTTPVPVATLWPGYDTYPIDAVARLGSELLGGYGSPPSSPISGPGPVLGSGTLCDQISYVTQSLCSLTNLLHKMIDACYSPSAWPTRPYPGGCGSPCNGSNGNCGCSEQGQQLVSSQPENAK